ncbi:TetR/AcrR family transcriptional regulator [Nocardia sp. NBC_00508]|uniref:TetR/AcrR family transcriptional regulator n=1 Tax=Nocardia sp. NBC_00508 TaxID=2975992 RepID=UPI002E81AC06|nr:TetR/AcrR family transcriptional regulator [Nocardia sp. NBC_00508]WUD67841.1 TetR/AcrR family transcriptional regulator [Nocardia sp. NBC_00508]
MPDASPLRREPVQQRSRERVQRILDAALRIVTTAGADAATVRSVAERAGVPAATVYQFFTNRDAIFEQLLARELVRLDGELAESLATARPLRDIAAAVEAFFAFHRRHYMSHPDFVALYYASRHNEAVRDDIREHLGRLTDLFHRHLLSTGLLAPGTSRRVVEMAVELGDRVFEVAHQRGDEGDALTDEGRIAITRYLQVYAGARRHEEPMASAAGQSAQASP